MEKKSGELSFGKVIPLPIEEEIKHSYLDYAMSVIVGRALPMQGTVSNRFSEGSFTPCWNWAQT